MLKNITSKKGILKIISLSTIFIIMAISLSIMYFYNYNKKSEEVNVLGGSGTSIDADSVELTANLEKLTNVEKYENLKKSMKDESQNEITNLAIRKGIIAKQ